MPEWLVQSLSIKLSTTEKKNVWKKVLEAGEKHDEQYKRIIPTEKELNIKFNI